MISHKDTDLSAHFDSVLMLTWSNWHTEMRSNRYHYATRFARHLPVIFVQPDIPEARFYFENIVNTNIVILHIYERYGPEQSALLNQALCSRNFIKPLLWIYNYLFIDFVTKRYSPLKIYHATEDYFSSDFKGIPEIEKLKRLLTHIGLLVTVSEGVKDNYVQKGRYFGEYTILPNGCDFKFWAPQSEEIRRLILQRHDDKRIIFYQGGINYRLDFELIDKIVEGTPDREFWFCGELDPRCDEWKPLVRKHNNLKYLGKLPPEEVRELAYRSTVGIIPFVQNDMIIERSFPLKAFEYVACGLPVVTVPIRSLQSFGEIFWFSETPDEFIDGIRSLEPSRFDGGAIEKRLEVANREDYDKRFEVLQSWINTLLTSSIQLSQAQFNTLILYDDKSTYIKTIFEHLYSFSLSSQHEVFYAIATHGARCTVDLSLFDVIIIHYSVRLSLDWHLSPHYAEALRRSGSLKILFIQDEYNTTEVARKWIEDIGISVVFTCVPEKYIESVYPTNRFPHVEFIPTLTGYVPVRFENRKTWKPLSERKIIIGYRGRPSPYWYGNLGREKLIIGERMRQICNEHGIAADIEWDTEKRIYGEAWYEFLENCRSILGTESGSNVFDENGDLMKNISEDLKKDPLIPYDEIHTKYLAEYEGKIEMNQISPKIFEAIAHKTALVLFEGSYSGIVKPEVHYIPLRKDFSNIDYVLSKLSDDSYLEKLTNRAYADIIETGKYNYKKFIQDLDNFLVERVVKGGDCMLLLGLIGNVNQRKLNLHKGIFDSDKDDFIRSIPTRIPIDILIPSKLSLKEVIENILLKHPFLFRFCRKTYRAFRIPFNQFRKLGKNLF